MHQRQKVLLFLRALPIGEWRSIEDIALSLGRLNPLTVQAELMNLRRAEYGGHSILRRTNPEVKFASQYRLGEPPADTPLSREDLVGLLVLQAGKSPRKLLHLVHLLGGRVRIDHLRKIVAEETGD